ncbi:Crp/Fnr family transcriptional regulator [Pseudanabaenaceae cyanobacterium LEGE 13415]|nr:Crp/Fnr family transcriptional regulator [Pseudanabaenaceae cyanobacterium LEGE 13415]
MIEQLSTELQTLLNWQTVPQGQVIFREGEPADLLYFLDSGQVRLLHYTSAGKAVDHYRIEAGEFFSEVVLFLDNYACTAIAERRSRIAAIPTTAFLAELRRNSELSARSMSQMARRLHITKIVLELRSLRSARERVLRYLQNMIPLVGEPERSQIQLTRSFRSIAGDLGISPEVFSRTLRQLQEEGVIDRVNRTIVLRND